VHADLVANPRDVEKMYVRLAVYAVATGDQHLMESGELVCDPSLVVGEAVRLSAKYIGVPDTAGIARIEKIIANAQGAPREHARGTAPRYETPGHRANPSQCAAGAALAKLDPDELAVGSYRGLDTLVARTLPDNDDAVRDYLTVVSVMES
jgi:hypothetical protein